MVDFDASSILSILKDIREIFLSKNHGLATNQPQKNFIKSDSGSSNAVSRAEQWVRVKMPYCGGVAGGPDSICGGKCKQRVGEQKNPIWDKYRTDCSGLISWAWGLPPPGAWTGSLAPYDNSISTTIKVDDLQPGDALNSKPRQHVALFAGWVSPGMARIIQTTSCGNVAHETIEKLTKVDDDTVMSSGGMHFQPIRAGGSASASTEISLISLGLSDEENNFTMRPSPVRNASLNIVTDEKLKHEMKKNLQQKRIAFTEGVNQLSELCNIYLDLTKDKI